MKYRLLCLIILITLISLTSAYPQEDRRGQIELRGGVALPMAPNYFSKWYSMAYSIHGQYVLFLTQQLGISIGVAYEPFVLNEDGFIEEWTGYKQIDWARQGYDLNLDVHLNIFEISLGVRPYLTQPDENFQLFVFGMGTYNIINSDVGYTLSDGVDTVSENFDSSEERFGIAVGGGMEMPVGDTLNFIFQAVYRFIFVDKLTNGDTVNFLGLSAGIAL